MPDYADTELDFTDAESCYHFVRSSLEPYGLEPSRDTRLRLKLEAGTDPEGTKVMRPYVRVAALLDRAKNTKHLIKGKGGAAFRDIAPVIASWRAEQAEMDVGLSLTLPPAASTGVLPSKGSFAVPTHAEWT